MCVCVSVCACASVVFFGVATVFSGVVLTVVAVCWSGIVSKATLSGGLLRDRLERMSAFPSAKIPPS